MYVYSQHNLFLAFGSIISFARLRLCDFHMQSLQTKVPRYLEVAQTVHG